MVAVGLKPRPSGEPGPQGIVAAHSCGCVAGATNSADLARVEGAREPLKAVVPDTFYIG